MLKMCKIRTLSCYISSFINSPLVISAPVINKIRYIRQIPETRASAMALVAIPAAAIPFVKPTCFDLLRALTPRTKPVIVVAKVEGQPKQKAQSKRYDTIPSTSEAMAKSLPGSGML